MNKLAVCTDFEDSIKDFHVASNVLNIVDDVYPSLMNEWKCIETIVDKYLLNKHLTYLKQNYPETSFIQKYYSDEAWKVVETIKNILIRIKNFFLRTTQYIRVFVVMRIGAAETIVKQWAHICETRESEVEEYLKTQEKKEIPADILTQMLSRSTELYKQFQDQFTKVATMTESSVTSGDNAGKLVEDPPIYADWQKDSEAVESANPRNKETMGKTAKTLLDGQWGDAVVMERLWKAAAQARVVMGDLQRLQNNAKKILSDLETSDDTPSSQKTDNDGGKAKVQMTDMLKRKKLEFIKRFSSEVMQKLISIFVKYVSECGNICKSLCNAMDKTKKNAQNVKA